MGTARGDVPGTRPIRSVCVLLGRGDCFGAVYSLPPSETCGGFVHDGRRRGREGGAEVLRRGGGHEQRDGRSRALRLGAVRRADEEKEWEGQGWRDGGVGRRRRGSRHGARAARGGLAPEDVHGGDEAREG